MHLVDHLLAINDVKPSHGHIHVTALQSQASHQGTKLSDFRILSFESSLSDRLNFGEDEISFNLPLINILIDPLGVLVDVLIKFTVEGILHQLLVIHLRNYDSTSLAVSHRHLSIHLLIRLEVIDLSAHVGRCKALTSVNHFGINRGHDTRHWTLHAEVTMLREYLLLLHGSVGVLVGLEVRATSHGIQIIGVLRPAGSEQVG